MNRTIMVVLSVFLTIIDPPPDPRAQGLMTPMPGEVSSKMAQDDRLDGKFVMRHLTGITTMIFRKGSNKVVIYYYNLSTATTFTSVYAYAIQDGNVTTYTEPHAIEEFGEFYKRPYKFSDDGRTLTITGLTTNGDAAKDFTFVKE